MENDDRALTIKEVAEFLNISNQMVYNLIKSSDLPAFKIGSALRILYSDLKAYIGKQKQAFMGKTLEFRNTDNSLFTIHRLNAEQGGFCLQDINISFPRGKTLAILGPSGSGKTMLLRSIAGFNAIKSGYIFLGENRIDNCDPQQRQTGFVFQNHILFSQQTIKGKKQKPGDEAVEKLIIGMIAAQPHLKNALAKLPGGTGQLSDFVRDKISPFELILMDEPFDQLDPETLALATALVRKIITETGKTSILAFSNARDILAMQSDYTAIINQGKIIQFGKTGDVYNAPATAFVARLSSAMGINSLQVEVQNSLILPWRLATTQPDGTYLMLFRTEEIRLADEGITVHTESRRFFDGRQTIVTAKTGQGEMLTLLVPENSGTDFSFVPTHPFLFAQSPDHE